MNIAIILILSAVILVLCFLLWKSLRGQQQEGLIVKIEETTAALRQELSGIVQKTSLDLNERIVKSNSDVRQEISDRIINGFKDVQDRVERQLSEGRQEQSSRFSEFRTETEKKLLSVEDKIQAELVAGRKELHEGLNQAINNMQQSLEGIRSKVDERLQVIGEQVQTKLDENIKEGFRHFEKVQEHLKAAETQLQSLSMVGSSINELNNLLKLPHLRGGFGESTLERLLADFLAPEQYELQALISTNSQERVDALIKLPRANLPIDSKFPREQVLPLFETSDADTLAEARKVLAQAVKGLAKSIASKYIRPGDGTTDVALLFLPSETLYFEVIRDGDLWETLKKEKVFPVSPNTLSVTLYGISMAYDYYEMARNVEKTIEDIRKAQRHFGHFQKKFDDVGKGLDKAQTAFHTAATHLGHYSTSVIRLTGEQPSEITDSGTQMLPAEEGE